MLNISRLKYPLKKYSLPDKLIYCNSIYKHGDKFEKFYIFSTNQNCKAHGEMYCFKEHILRPDSNDFVPSLYIDFLFSTKSGEGFGTSLLNFAKNYSKKIGCEGRIHLMASSGLVPQRAPQVFYKKCGLNSADKTTNKKLDQFIKKHKNATYKDFHNTPMYYPPIKFPESRFLDFFERLFFIK